MVPIRECDLDSIIRNLGMVLISAQRVEYGVKQLADAMRENRVVFVGELHVNIQSLNSHSTSGYLSSYTRLKGKANYQYMPGTGNINTNLVFDMICLNTSSLSTSYDLDSGTVTATEKTLPQFYDLNYKFPFCTFSGYVCNVGN
jgi:hypothetical protein